MMIEVFKTDVTDEWKAKEIKELLLERFPGSRINFDLHDCDRILRIEGTDFSSEHIIMLVENQGIVCSILD